LSTFLARRLPRHIQAKALFAPGVDHDQEPALGIAPKGDEALLVLGRKKTK